MKKRIFINLTNHPMDRWEDKQLKAARALLSPSEELEVEMVELPFPHIDPNASHKQVKDLAAEYVQKVIEAATYVSPATLSLPAWKDLAVTAILVMGEMNFTYHFVTKIKAAYSDRMRCFATTSNRNTVDNEDGTKSVKFEFTQFRHY